MVRKGYPIEFRRRALDLVAADRPITDVARDLDISSQSIYRRQRQDRIDEGLEPGVRRLRQPSSQRPSNAPCSSRPSSRSRTRPWSC